MKHVSDLVFSLREQIKSLKEENETKTFIIKSLLQNQNNLSNMGTNFLLQQRKLQSFDENISEEISMDNCFSERKRSNQVYTKEQLDEDPESSICSNNDVDFKIEPTKRKHDVKKSVDVDIQILNGISKANIDSYNTNKDHVSNANANIKEKCKNKDNH